MKSLETLRFFLPALVVIGVLTWCAFTVSTMLLKRPLTWGDLHEADLKETLATSKDETSEKLEVPTWFCVLFYDAPVTAQTFKYLSFFRKFARGESLTILVFGGSETIGRGCETPTGLTRKDCAWSGHLRRWLSQLKPSIELHNLAVEATSSRSLLLELGGYASLYPNADLIIVDFLVNDLTLPSIEDGSVVFESLLRKMSEFFANAALMSFEGACKQCAGFSPAHRGVVEYYHVLTLNFNLIVEAASNETALNKLWYADSGGSYSRHPGWETHVYIADAIVFAIKRKLGMLCALANERHGDSKPLHMWTPYNSIESLKKFQVCRSYSSSYSAYNYSEQQSQAAVQNGFTLRDYPPGKPGWISTVNMSTITFPLRAGRQGIVCVTYLKSYEKMAKAVVEIRNGTQSCLLRGNTVVNTWLLNGHWATKASLQYTSCYGARKGRSMTCMGEGHPMKMSLVHQGENGTQFKVISIRTC